MQEVLFLIVHTLFINLIPLISLFILVYLKLEKILWPQSHRIAIYLFYSIKV